MLILTSFSLRWSSKERRHKGSRDTLRSPIFVCRCIVLYDVFKNSGENIPSAGDMANERLFKSSEKFIIIAMVAVLGDKPALVPSMLYSYISIDPRDDRYTPFCSMLSIRMIST